jgi:hypothetical protein
MEKILKHIIPLILTLSLLGCQTPPADMTPPAPTASHTPIPTATPTLTPTPTEVPLETLPVEELVQKYLAGEINDVSGLSFEQQKDFSIALNEHRKEQRGANPIIYTDRNGDKFYVDPVTLDFAPLGDGATAEQQTIDNRKPKVTDSEGFAHVYDNGEWVKIAGSDKIQFNNFDNFPWPAGEVVDPKWVSEEHKHLLNLTVPEHIYKIYGEEVNMVPFFFLGKEHGKTSIPNSSLRGTLLGYVITENNPFSVTSAMITGLPVLYADDLRADNPGNIVEHGNFYKEIVKGNLYYLMYKVDQTKAFASTYPSSNGQEATVNYNGLAPSGQTHGIVTGEISSDDLPLINTLLLVEAGE